MKGIISKVWNNKTKEGKNFVVYEIEGKKFSAFNSEFMGFVEGQEVEYEFEVKGKYANIKAISPIINETQQSIQEVKCADSFEVTRRNGMLKFNCLNNATTYICENGGEGKDILPLAKKMFNEWSAWINE